MEVRLDSLIPMLKTPTNQLNDSLPLSIFTWRQALYQAKWSVCIYPSEEQRLNIMRTAQKLMEIGALFPGKDLIITSFLRCPAYNHSIGGATNSMHVTGLAVDFRIDSVPAHEVRQQIAPLLDGLEIRMERLPQDAGWCHIDLKESEPRYFNP